VLPTDWLEEFLRILEDECGMAVDSPGPPEDLAEHVLLTVDHGAPVTVGVIGDSLTSQIRDELAADPRYNWVVASLCAARLDQYLGTPVAPTPIDLSFATDAVLAADPDVVLVALGTADTRQRPTVVHTANIDAMMDLLDSVPCPMWMNLHVSDFGEPANTTWARDATAFNAALEAQGAAHRIPRIDWNAVTSDAGSGMAHPWLLPGPYDLTHVSVPLGHHARVGMILDAVQTCAGSR
jgi:hypothetical protein